MRKKVSVLVGLGVLALCVALDSNPCNALEKLRVYRGVLILEGKIVPGDYISVWNFLRDESNFKKISEGVFLASPGGYIREAMKIGWLIRQLRLGTDAPSRPSPDARNFGDAVIRASDLVDRSNYQCVSACFLVFVAGIHRNLNGVGRLGIHRPKLETRSTELSIEAVRDANIGIRNLIEHYLDDMNVPRKYADLMFSVPSNGVRWITQNEFDSDLKGYIPQVRDWIDGKCNPWRDQGVPANTSMSEKGEQLAAKQSAEALKCMAQVRTDLPIQAWRNLFRPN